jgi:hypothetical protein
MIAWVVIDRRHFTQSGLCEGSRQASPFASAPYSFISFTSFVSHLPYSLPSSVSRNSFVWHSYETAGGCANNSQCGKFPLHSKGTFSPRLYSSSFFSHSCALLCTEKNSTPSFSSDSALFAQKHRGWGTHLLFNAAKTHRIQGRMMLWP